MRQLVRLALAAAVSTTLLACASGSGGEWVDLDPGGNGPTFELTGTVEHRDIEGGLWLIRDEDGVSVQPTNLPESFRRDGMIVEAVARRRTEQVSIGMAGTLIELLRIREAVDGTSADDAP